MYIIIIIDNHDALINIHIATGEKYVVVSGIVLDYLT